MGRKAKKTSRCFFLSLDLDDPPFFSPHHRQKNIGLFEVLVETPPPRSLGLHDLPPDTHNGDRIEIDERAYVVRRLVLRYRLEKGKYVKATQAVEVASQGRFLVDQFLNQLVEK